VSCPEDGGRKLLRNVCGYLYTSVVSCMRVCGPTTVGTDNLTRALILILTMAYPGILFGRGGGSTNSVEDTEQREWGSGGGSPLVRGSGGSCNLVQEISFHIVKFS